MATEKIINIKVNAKDAIKQLETLDQEIDQLEDGVNDLNRGLVDLEKQLVNTTPDSKGMAARNRYKKQITQTKAAIKEQTVAVKQSKSAKAKLEKQTRKNNTTLKKQAKAHNDVNKGLIKSIGGTSVLDRATGGLFSSIQGATQGMKGFTSGLGKVKIAFAATGIGLFVIALGALVTYFKSSEEGQDKLTKALNKGKAVIANMVELFSDFGKGISGIFGSLKNLATGKGSVNDVFKEVGNTVDTVKKKVGSLSKDIKEDVAAAGVLSDMIAKADKIDRKLVVDRQRLNVKINTLRTKAYNTDKFNSQERLAFLKEAIIIEDDITNREIKAAGLRFQAKKMENEMTSLVRKEDLDELAKLEAKTFQLDAVKVNRLREVKNQEQTILRQDATAKQKVKDDAYAAEKEFDEMVAEEKAEKAEKDKQDEEIAAEKRNELRKKELEAEKAKAEAEDRIRNAQVDTVARGFALLSQLAGKNRAMQAIALVGMNAAGIAKQIINTQAANAGVLVKNAPILAPAGPLLSAAEIKLNNISLGIGIASSVAATAKGLSALKAGGNAGGGSAPQGGGRQMSASSASPEFNIVGQAPENQLVNAIQGATDKPIQAFVVGSEVSTQQALDRNIIENASLG